MKRGVLRLVLFAQAGWLSAGADGAAPAAYDSLLANSPFGPRATESRSSVTPNFPLELRGVIVDNGEVLFSLFDFASHSSRWVGLNEPGNLFTVHGYDGAKGEVKVDYHGRELTLGLKQATIIALAPPPVPAAGAIPGQQAGSPQPALFSGVPPDEAVRLAQIAEEISRRRAQRQLARQPPAPGLFPPGPDKGKNPP